MIDFYEDVFWFAEEVLSKELGMQSGNIYNIFVPTPIETIRSLKELYVSGKYNEYRDMLNYYKNKKVSHDYTT